MTEFNASIKPLDPNLWSGFKELDIKYWTNPEAFNALIQYLPNFNEVEKQIQLKKSNYKNRNQLVKILKEQYDRRGIHDANNVIDQLASEDTYTIICAHQPCLLGGPLYWWYKIIHTICLSKELKKDYPQYNFIPIYYAGNEDHDFEEINHLFVFNKKISWNNIEIGSSGRMNISQMPDVIHELKSLFGNQESAIQELEHLSTFLEDSKNYNDFYFRFVHHLFGRFGLLYFNPDCKEAKKLITEQIQAELLENRIYHSSQKSIAQLNHLGYSPQAHIREINLFYLENQYRTGIYKTGEIFHTKDEKYKWTKEEILLELQSNPERFSPNVVLRPLYQESLFPNIIFIGGGAEIAYWMQLKSVFDDAQIPYPILMRRFSAILVSPIIQQKISLLQLQLEDFFEDIIHINNKYLSLHSSTQNEINLSSQRILESFKKHTDLSLSFDQSIQSFVQSEFTKIEHQLEKITSKLIKADKTKFESELKKIEKMKETLFPNSGLQERSESGLQYYLQYGSSFVDFLINHFENENKFLGLFIQSKN